MEKTLYSFNAFGRTSELLTNDIDLLSFYGLLNNTSIEIDRFGFLNQFSNLNLGQSDNFLELKYYISPTYENFREIFYDKIKSIVNKNQKIYVSWSGGVDSSAIVCGLLSYSGFNKSLLNVLHTKESISEFPKLYEILVKNNVNMIDLTNDVNGTTYCNTINDGLLIMGWCADQLFGSIINQEYPDYFNKPYEKWIVDISCKINFNCEDSIEQIKMASDYYGIPIKTFPEWTWFMNFFVKWNLIKLTPYAIIGKYSENIINFFDEINFQRWSVSNFDSISKLAQSNSMEYKLELKRIIEEYTKDTDYTRNKGKEASWYYVESKQNIVKAAIIDNEGFKSFKPNFNVPKTRLNSIRTRIIESIIKNYRK